MSDFSLSQKNPALSDTDPGYTAIGYYNRKNQQD